MKMSKAKLLTFIISMFCLSNLTFAQSKGFKNYTNKTYHFSFDIPSTWQVIYSKKQEGLICVPTTIAEKKHYSECLEGIVFRITIEPDPVASLLNGINVKVDGSYYTIVGRFQDTVMVRLTKGSNWKGLSYTNSCGISCKGSGFHAAAGECGFLSFANNKETVTIDTNGEDFDPKVRQRLISSFQFN